MNLKFYLVSVLVFLISVVGGFYTGLRLIYNLMFSVARDPYGEEALTFVSYAVIFTALGAILGLIVALIIIEKIGRYWGKYLTFGSHPVLKLTALSFVTYLIVLFFILKVYNFLTG